MESCFPWRKKSDCCCWYLLEAILPSTPHTFDSPWIGEALSSKRLERLKLFGPYSYEESYYCCWYPLEAVLQSCPSRIRQSLNWRGLELWETGAVEIIWTLLIRQKRETHIVRQSLNRNANEHHLIGPHSGLAEHILKGNMDSGLDFIVGWTSNRAFATKKLDLNPDLNLGSVATKC
jgi:hypothetical protein